MNKKISLENTPLNREELERLRDALQPDAPITAKTVELVKKFITQYKSLAPEDKKMLNSIRCKVVEASQWWGIRKAVSSIWNLFQGNSADRLIQAFEPGASHLQEALGEILQSFPGILDTENVNPITLEIPINTTKFLEKIKKEIGHLEKQIALFIRNPTLAELESISSLIKELKRKVKNPLGLSTPPSLTEYQTEILESLDQILKKVGDPLSMEALVYVFSDSGLDRRKDERMARAAIRKFNDADWNTLVRLLQKRVKDIQNKSDRDKLLKNVEFLITQSGSRPDLKEDLKRCIVHLFDQAVHDLETRRFQISQYDSDTGKFFILQSQKDSLLKEAKSLKSQIQQKHREFFPPKTRIREQNPGESSYAQLDPFLSIEDGLKSFFEAINEMGVYDD